MRVSHLYIAQVKRASKNRLLSKCGIIERENYNKPKSENAGQPHMPSVTQDVTPEKEAAVRAALEYYGMIG